MKPGNQIPLAARFYLKCATSVNHQQRTNEEPHALGLNASTLQAQN